MVRRNDPKSLALLFLLLGDGRGGRGCGASSGKKEQASRCCIADVFLCQSENQLYNNKKIDKPALFSTAW